MNWYKLAQINKKDIKLSINTVKDFVDVFRDYKTKSYPISVLTLIQRVTTHAGNDIISENAAGRAWRGKVDDQTINDLKIVLDKEYADARDFAKQRGKGSGFYIRKLHNIYNAFGISPSGEIYDYTQEKWINQIPQNIRDNNELVQNSSNK